MSVAFPGVRESTQTLIYIQKNLLKTKIPRYLSFYYF